jgi:hypothetical protein
LQATNPHLLKRYRQYNFGLENWVDTAHQRRRGTRVPAQIPVRLSSLDPSSTFSENCHTLVVNPQGCGVRFPRPLKPGLQIRIENLPGGGSTTARVACSLPLNYNRKYWLVGISLDTPGNLWCLAPAPQDWGQYADVPKFFPASLKSPGDKLPGAGTRIHEA